jgi:hypothetical protein
MKNKRAVGKSAKFTGNDPSFSPQMITGRHIRPLGEVDFSCA